MRHENGVPTKQWLALLVISTVAGGMNVAPGPAPKQTSVVRAVSDEFLQVADTSSKMVRITGGTGATDGLAYSRLAYLLFSDLGQDAILKYTPALKFVSGRSIGETVTDAPLTTFRKPGGGVRGLTFDRQGRLLACESAARRVTRTEKNGRLTVLASRYRDRPLNGPRDVVHAIDGSTYFTDPERDDGRGGNAAAPGVYQITRTGELRLVASGFSRPTGVTLSPDHRILYCSDAAGQIRAFDIVPDGSLGPARTLAAIVPERGVSAGGIKTDVDGRLYCAGPGGIWVFDRQGKHLGMLSTPEPATNLGWGDDYSALYVAAVTSLYRIALKVAGARTF